ncbi:hypothetical protein QHJ03_004025 [Salmonella enterica]|uniref:DMT family transporter n=1 Tax=Salmonella enterica TaxID=28901 RepID=UPI00071CB904|nr:SMR family transporter [Salmonella enterica]EBM9478496.1 quaternary ammonium compound-resistance protein SugE [Salmonella enterica subsp. enterica serovar Rubislaw]ECT6468432.1 quaternary ammonium compound-resistance protein SugE [Salmonella enterica subsp. enterica serovar Senegal]EHC8527868.1 quaternary ammonium compound-resistance protein SugE [Salmonella enterica subsp. enterica serovar 11:r:-]EAQ5803286.1 quaternary ammonium compound-resistance protein SugE [Salmonella enterica]EBO3245
MSWFFLIAAGLLEIIVVIGIRNLALGKYSIGVPSYILGICSSLYCLYLSMQYIDVSIAYAAYTGIGVIGTVAFGMLFWQESRSKRKLTCLFFIVISLVCLKMQG